MKTTRLERFYIAILAVILAGIVLHAPLSVGFGILFPDYALLIKSWKELLMIILIPMAATIIIRRGLWTEISRDWIFRVIVAYVVVHIALVLFLYQGINATLAGLAIDLRYIAFFSLVYIGLKAVPGCRRLMLTIALTGAFIVVGFATLQFFLPPDILKYIGYSEDTIVPYLTVDKNPDYIRVNSTLRGPNPLGAYAGMVLGLITAALVRGRINLKSKKQLIGTLILGVCSVTALWISYSRSALFAAILTVLIVLLLTTLRKLSYRAWVTSSVIVFALVGALIAGRDSDFVSNVILHENPAGGSSISSNDDHISSLQYGVGQLLREPLGSGVGSTGSASLFSDTPIVVENQYLFIGHETGWLGLALFVALMALIFLRLWANRRDWLSLGVLASGVGLSAIGILLPVWVDDTVSIVWWGLAAIALAGIRHGRK